MITTSALGIKFSNVPTLNPLEVAILNECIWRTQTEEFWVNFKVWGMLPITIIFTGFQIPLINKHKIDA